MYQRLTNRLTSAAELRAVIGEPTPRIASKARSALNADAQAFIAASPFVLVGSTDASGHLDVSPKGDAPGFVRVLDERTLAIPDRPGNRRADTLINVIETPRAALLFLVPGVTHTLRASGAAAIVRDDWLLREMTVDGNAPALALIVEIDEVFFHCPKCFHRSALWTPRTWCGTDGLAPFERLRAVAT